MKPVVVIDLFAGKKDIWAAIGNAVCPPVAEAIIRGIIQ